jgi:hypothetical protein
MAKGKKKTKKDKKGKKRAPRGLPTAVKGLLQYLGGQDATLQQSSRPRGATPSDGGETLSRYLSAKTAILESQKQQIIGAGVAQQTEERLLAKRKQDDLEKELAMLQVGIKKGDVQKTQTARELEEVKRAVQSQQQEQLYRDLRERKMRAEGREQLFNIVSQQRPLPSEYSLGSKSTPSAYGRAPSYIGSDYAYSEVGLEEGSEFGSLEPDIYAGGGGGGGGGGGSVASELYLENAPTGRPIIRDRPRREPRQARSVVSAPKKSASPEQKKTQVSAGELRSRISEVTGLARSRYKLPSRTQYASVASALQNATTSSADLISALKEAGVNIAEA